MSAVDVDLDITEMTCTSCTTRIERKLAMALSSVFVVTNSVRLQRFHPLPAPTRSYPTTRHSDASAAARV